MEGQGGLPGWLSKLMEETFFVVCETHESMRSIISHTKNILCLHCCISICPFCALSHTSHLLLQVRRYVYNDVVRFDDLKKLIDCCFIKPYSTGSEKVIYLKPRPQTRVSNGSENICLRCNRILQGNFRYCSLTCKVEHVLLQGIDISSILVRFDASDFALTKIKNLQMDDTDLPDDEVFDDNQITPDPALKDSVHWEAGSSSGLSINEKTDGSEKKDDIAPSHSKRRRRRKGSPHRSIVINKER